MSEEKPKSQVPLTAPVSFTAQQSTQAHLWRLYQGRVWSLAAVPSRGTSPLIAMVTIKPVSGTRSAGMRWDALYEMMVQI